MTGKEFTDFYNPERVAKIMESLGFRITKIDFPEHERSVDLIADRRDAKLLVKVTPRFSTRRRDCSELKRVAELLNTDALVITDRYNRDEIPQDVAYIRGRIGMVSFATLVSILRGGKVLAYEFNGVLYVKVDGAKLRELRVKRGLSVNALSKLVGVSAKAIHEYEQGVMDMRVEVAERFAEIFGDEFEEAIKGVDIFKFRIRMGSERRVSNYIPQVQNGRSVLVKKAAEYGFEVDAFDHLPSDVLVRIGEVRAFFSFLSKGISEQQALKKCTENVKLAKEFEGKAVVVAEEVTSDVAKELEGIGDVFRFNQIDNVLKELAREARR